MTSADQGLRAVLNGYDAPLRAVAAQNAFASIGIMLKAYAAGRRIKINLNAKPPANRDLSVRVNEEKRRQCLSQGETRVTVLVLAVPSLAGCHRP